MKFSPKFLDTLRSRLTLSEIIGQRVRLVKKGREHHGLCPFHNEKTPSFTVNDEKEFYHCFGCGAHGDAVRFLVETQNYTFPEAVKDLAERAGVPLPLDDAYPTREPVSQDLYTAMEDAAAWFQSQIFSSHASHAQSYLESRGFSPPHVKEYGLGYAPRLRQGLKQALLAKGYKEHILIEAGLLIKPEDDGESYDRFRERIMFPIHNIKGQVIAFGGRILGEGQPKYLNSPETPIFSKGHLLYNYHHARKVLAKGSPPIVVEGYTDVLGLRKAGIEGAVAPLGTALTEDQIRLLWRLSPEPILCFDGDNAGQKAAMRASERVLSLLKPGYTLNFVYLPKGEDPDSYVRAKGRQGFESLLEKKHSLVDILWLSMTYDKNLAAPEQKALVLKEIDTLTQKIEDPASRTTLRAALKDKYYSLRGQPFHKNTARLSMPQNLSEKITKSLLAIALNHPHILNEFSEELAAIEIFDYDLTSLQQDLLDFAVAHESNSVEDLHLYLKNKGHLLEGILNASIYALAPYARREADAQEVNAGWKMMYNQYQDELIHAEIKQLQEDLAKEMSAKAWTRLSELRKLLEKQAS